MHERSLVRALLRQIEEVAAEHEGSRVVAVSVQIGELSGVEPELLASAYDDLVHETQFFGSVLNLERIPLSAFCDECGNEFRIERYRFECDQCGSRQLTLRGGEELLLDSVTLEETLS